MRWKFDIDTVFIKMLKGRENYKETLEFKSAFLDYLEGDWKQAANKFKEILYKNPIMSPSNSLYNYIKKLNFIVPKNWRGHRLISEII